MNAISYPINITAEEVLSLYFADLDNAANAKDVGAAFLAVDAKVQVTLDIRDVMPGLLSEEVYDALDDCRLAWEDFEFEILNGGRA